MARDWPRPDDPPSSRLGRLFDYLGLTAIVLATLAPLVGCASRLIAAAPIPRAGTTFTCRPVAAWDGDGPIWCREGPRIRLAGVNARELDGSCRPGARCPAMSGPAARNVLVQLLGGPRGTLSHGHVRVAGPRLACRSSGADRYRRTLATCRLGRADLATLLVDAGAVAR